MPWDSSLGSHNAVEIVQSNPENETQNLKVEALNSASGPFTVTVVYDQFGILWSPWLRDAGAAGAVEMRYRVSFCSISLITVK
jgi:hypothetical protein